MFLNCKPRCPAATPINIHTHFNPAQRFRPLSRSTSRTTPPPSPLLLADASSKPLLNNFETPLPLADRRVPLTNTIAAQPKIVLHPERWVLYSIKYFPHRTWVLVFLLTQLCSSKASIIRIFWVNSLDHAVSACNDINYGFGRSIEVLINTSLKIYG